MWINKNLYTGAQNIAKKKTVFTSTVYLKQKKKKEINERNSNFLLPILINVDIYKSHKLVENMWNKNKAKIKNWYC